MHYLQRVAGISILLLTLVESLLLSPVWAAGEVVRLSFFPALPSNAGIYVAQAKGFYEQQSLTVEIVHMEGGQDQITAVASGSVDFGIVVTPNVLLAQEAGLPISIVGVKQISNEIGTVSLSESSIMSPRDYSGRSFASDAGSVEFQLLPALAQVNHFDASSVLIKQVDYSVALAALLRGDVDLVAQYYASGLFEWQRAAEKVGKQLTFIRWAEYGLPFYGDAFITSRRNVTERADVVRRFLEATVQGFVYAVDHPDEACDIVFNIDPSQDLDAVRENWRRTVETMKGGEFWTSGWGRVEKDRLQKTREIILKAYGRSATLPIENIYTNDFLPKLKPAP